MSEQTTTHGAEQSLEFLLEEAEHTRRALAEVRDRKAQMILQFDEMIESLEAKLASLLADETPAPPSKIGRML